MILVAAMLASLAAGCGGKKRGGALVDNRPSYKLPTSPQNVLDNLIQAYMVRDTVATALAYDDAYQGTSIDLRMPRPDLHFTKADEIRHVGRLRLDPDIISVSVNLGPFTNWQRQPPDASDPSEYAVIQINNGRVSLSDFGSGTTYDARADAMIYTFRPTPDSSSPTDSTWKIVRWTEIAN